MQQQKIQNAIDRGELILYDKLFHSYPKEKQERVREKARYLKAAMALRELRRETRLSQSELASRMRVRREYISRVESGAQNITLDTLYRFGDAVGKKLELNFR
jgi:predicted transcriptional regulator